METRVGNLRPALNSAARQPMVDFRSRASLSHLTACASAVQTAREQPQLTGQALAEPAHASAKVSENQKYHLAPHRELFCF